MLERTCGSHLVQLLASSRTTFVIREAAYGHVQTSFEQLQDEDPTSLSNNFYFTHSYVAIILQP